LHGVFGVLDIAKPPKRDAKKHGGIVGSYASEFNLPVSKYFFLCGTHRLPPAKLNQPRSPRRHLVVQSLILNLYCGNLLVVKELTVQLSIHQLERSTA
jgi:hypothetical protein